MLCQYNERKTMWEKVSRLHLNANKTSFSYVRKFDIYHNNNDWGALREQISGSRQKYFCERKQTGYANE